MKLISKWSDGKKETVPTQYIHLHTNIKLISEILMIWNKETDAVGIISSMEETWISIVAWTTITLQWSRAIRSFNLHEFNYTLSPKKINKQIKKITRVIRLTHCPPPKPVPASPGLTSSPDYP
jgi:hypothetical protein